MTQVSNVVLQSAGSLAHGSTGGGVGGGGAQTLASVAGRYRTGQRLPHSPLPLPLLYIHRFSQTKSVATLCSRACIHFCTPSRRTLFICLSIYLSGNIQRFVCLTGSVALKWGKSWFTNTDRKRQKRRGLDPGFPLLVSFLLGSINTQNVFPTV